MEGWLDRTTMEGLLERTTMDGLLKDLQWKAHGKYNLWNACWKNCYGRLLERTAMKHLFGTDTLKGLLERPTM